MQIKHTCTGAVNPCIVVLGLFAFILPNVHAASPEAVTQIIDRMTTAYGGRALEELRSISFYADRRLAWPGQGQTSAFVEFVHDRQLKHFDLESGRGSVERWIDQNGNVYHNRYVVDGSGGAVIDYFDMSVERNDAAFFDFFGSDYRSSDTLLAHLLTTATPDINRHERTVYRGEVFDVLSFEIMPDTQVIDAFVSQESGLIKRISMDQSIGTVNMVFDVFKTVKGVTHASEMRAYLNDTLVEYASGITLEVNSVSSEQLAVEHSLSEPAPTFDQSEMTVDELGDGVFHVGREDYSLFVRHNERWIVVNGFEGIAERLAAANEHIGEALDVSHVVYTHHHGEHINGIDEAVALGAVLIISPETEELLDKERSDYKLLDTLVVENNTTIGPLKFLLASTSHASDIVFVYAVSAKTLYQDGHYHALRVEGPSRIQPTASELYAVLLESGLDIRFIVSGHAKHAERWDTFKEGIQTQDALNKCPSGRAICRDTSARTDNS